MKKPTRSLASLRLHILCLCAVAALLGACASTSMVKTWKAPEKPQGTGKMAVLTVDQRGLLRQAFENRFASQLRKAGAPAQVTYELLSLPEIKEDKRAAGDRLRVSGANTVLIVRLVDATSSDREIQPGGEMYASTITGIESMGWYEYYSIGFMNMSPTYGSLKTRIYLETSLYDLSTEKRLWSGLTKTVLKENMDRLEELDVLVAKIVSAMRKDGVI